MLCINSSLTCLVYLSNAFPALDNLPLLNSHPCLSRAVSCHLQVPQGTRVTTGAPMEALQQIPWAHHATSSLTCAKMHRPPGQRACKHLSQKTLEAAFFHQAGAKRSFEAPSICHSSLPGGTLQHQTAHTFTVQNQMVQPLNYILWGWFS